MAKRKLAEGLRELDQLERLAKLSEDERLQYTRDLERNVARERAAKRELQRQLKQSEKELAATEMSLDRALHLQDTATLRNYEKAKKRRRGSSQATAIVCVNDWHTEQTVDPATVGGVNEFNLEIANRRIERTWDRALYLIDFARKISNIDEICLWAGGDLINGMIHEELQQTNALGPADAVGHVRDRVLVGIQRLMKETKCGHFRFLANYGNHGRANPQKRIHTAASHSWEYEMYVTIAQVIQADRVLARRFSHQITRGEMLKTEIQGFNCRFNHGDTVRYGGGVGGIMVPVNKAVAAWNKSHGQAELDVIGHFHQFVTTPNFVACGCLIGFDPYAQSIRATAEPPSQTLIVMDQEYGKVMTLQIFCEERTDAHRQWHTPEYGS
jgi:hypothetical protein